MAYDAAGGRPQFDLRSGSLAVKIDLSFLRAEGGSARCRRCSRSPRSPRAPRTPTSTGCARPRRRSTTRLAAETTECSARRRRPRRCSTRPAQRAAAARCRRCRRCRRTTCCSRSRHVPGRTRSRSMSTSSTIDNEKVDMPGTVKTPEEIDALATELKKIDCFKDISARSDRHARGRHQEVQADHARQVPVRKPMSAITDKATDFWDRISPRERRLVVIAAVAVPLDDRDLAGSRDPRRPRQHGGAQRQVAQGARRARRSHAPAADARSRSMTSSRRWAPSRCRSIRTCPTRRRRRSTTQEHDHAAPAGVAQRLRHEHVDALDRKHDDRAAAATSCRRSRPRRRSWRSRTSICGETSATRTRSTSPRGLDLLEGEARGG